MLQRCQGLGRHGLLLQNVVSAVVHLGQNSHLITGSHDMTAKVCCPFDSSELSLFSWWHAYRPAAFSQKHAVLAAVLCPIASCRPAFHLTCELTSRPVWLPPACQPV